MHICSLPQHHSSHAFLNCVLLAAAASCLAGCNDDHVLTIPKICLSAEYTPAYWQLKSEPQAAWKAVLAEMAEEPEQKPLALNSVDRVGSWSGKATKVVKGPWWYKFVFNGQMLTTAWIEADPSGRGSRLYLVRVYIFKTLTPSSNGDFERGMAQRIRARLGEIVLVRFETSGKKESFRISIEP